MDLSRRNIIRINLLLFLISGVLTFAHGQEMVNVLVKVYDIELKPYPFIGIVIDDTASITTDAKGTAFALIPNSSLPPTTVGISDQKLEAESWNYTRGTLEIVLRKKNYKNLRIKIADKNQKALSRIEILIATPKPMTLSTDSEGFISFVLPNTTQVNQADLFQIEGYTILEKKLDDQGGLIIIEETKASLSNKMEEGTGENPNSMAEDISADQKLDSEDEFFGDLTIQNLDSITSLTVLYALIKKVNYEELDSLPKNKLDEKFNELMQAKNLSSLGLKSPISLISDSSFISKDVMLIIDKIKNEKELLIINQEEFEKATEQINLKLKDGGKNLSIQEQEELIQLVLDLKEILVENEDLFYKNNLYYKKKVESIQDQIVEIFELEDLLVKSELLGRNFKQILIITFIAFVGLAMITLFFKFIIHAIRDQKNKLDHANIEIEKINANLEDMIFEKTVSLELINNELDTFLYRSSHNLRRPITSIRGLTKIAEFTPKGEADVLFENIELTAKAMENMVDKLTTMNHINQPVNFSDIDMVEIIDRLKLKFADQIEALEITFSMSLQPDIQFSSYPLVIEVILYNLLENAIFFCQFNKRTIRKVGITAKFDENKNLLLSIRDNGRGIQPEILDKIWDMFYIGNEVSKGGGLGLYITKKAVASLHGTIQVNTEKDKFCEFNIVLPYLQLSDKDFKKALSVRVAEQTELR